MSVQLTSTLNNFRNNLWSYYIAVPKRLGDLFIDKKNRRVICTINNTCTLHSALMPRGDEYTIYVRKELKAKLNIEEGDEVEVLLEKDNSKYGMPMPEVMETLLAQDDEGRNYFESLTMGRQRSLIYIINKVKNENSQLAKGLAILHHLKESSGVINFKRLNILIKQYNTKK